MQREMIPAKKKRKLHRVRYVQHVFEVGMEFSQVFVTNSRLVLGAWFAPIGFLHYKNTVEDHVLLLERRTSIKVALFTIKNGDEIAGKSCSGCYVRRFRVILALLRPQPNVETRKEGVEIFGEHVLRSTVSPFSLQKDWNTRTQKWVAAFVLVGTEETEALSTSSARNRHCR